ncbi:MAG: tetratricopeptide repeat protein [Rhodospirillaceae bacterium]
MPSSLAETFAEALDHHQAGRLPRAEALYRRVLAAAPDHPDSLHLLGVLCHQTGKSERALLLITRALAQKDDTAVYHHNLGEVLRALGRLEPALAAYRRAVALSPDWAEAHNHLGVALHQLEDYEGAVACYRRALALDPDDASAHNNLGVALQDQGDLAGALESYHRALSLNPDDTDAGNNLGNALKEQGRVGAAVAVYREILERHPALAMVRSNLLFSSLCLPDIPLAEHFEAARRWDALYAAPLRSRWPRHRPPRPGAPGRRPRLGFVSGDFRRHAVGFLTIAALEGLAAAGHEISCYSNGMTEDVLTDRFRAASARWRPLLGLSDAAAAEQIRADGIDILIDLSGHTAQNRLLTLALKPAPLQLTWVGYGVTTGLSAMDYWLADRHQVPEALEPWYQEKIIRMPASYVCFEPPAEAPPVPPLPALTRGHITFGSFNFLSKITDQAILLWSQILDRVPESRLLLKAVGFNGEATQRLLIDRFAAHGIGAGRLDFLGGSSRAEHLAATASVDIALDSFPYSGGLTTLETLWMGVPVIVWPGETLCSRHSYGYLASLGCTDTVATDAGEYVERAVAWAGDRARLADLRAGLRARLLASPLCDRAGFTAALELACQMIWARHCAGEPPRSITVPGRLPSAAAAAP